VLPETVDRAALGLREPAAAALARAGRFVARELLETLAGDEFVTAERRSAVLDTLLERPASAPPSTVPAAGAGGD